MSDDTFGIFSPRLLCANSFDSLENHELLGYLGRKDTPRVRFVLPFNWKGNPLRDNNWMFLVSSWRVMDPLIIRYFETKDSTLLDRIQNIALDWVSYHKANEPNQYTWYDMAVGIRALRLAFLLDQGGRGYIKLDHDIVEAAHKHVEILMDEPAVAINNHGIFQIAGLLSLAHLKDERDEVVSFSERKLKEILHASFTSEGISTEHSPAYHRFVYLSFAKFSPLFNEVEDISKAIRLAASNEAWLTMPSGLFAAIGDTDNDARGRILTSVAPIDTTTVDGHRVAVKFFQHTGYAVCRSLPSAKETFALFVTGSHFDAVHKHADDLSFIYESKGEMIFVDGGKYFYDYSDDRKYFMSARAHSTISVDDVDFPPDLLLDKGSSIKSVSVDGDEIRMTGSLTRPELFSQRREISFTPFKSIAVKDNVKSNIQRTFRSTLKFAPGVDLSLSDDGGAMALTPLHQRLVIRANRPIEIRTGLFSPSYGTKVPCPEISIADTSNETELVWEIHHAI